MRNKVEIVAMPAHGINKADSEALVARLAGGPAASE
jgi:hypothetical protein